MPDSETHHQLENALLALYGRDPFDYVVRESVAHRESHGSECGLYPAGHLVMRHAAAVVKACRPSRILDIGAGLGHSTLWLARAAGPHAFVQAIDRFAEHATIARTLSQRAGLEGQIEFLAAEAEQLLPRLREPYDLIHDDGWFAHEPSYFDDVVRLLRPGGILTMANWFLLEDALADNPARDWSEFAGPNWAAATLDYARKLIAHESLEVSWSFFPPLGIAVKRTD